jgi:hypothetical protein
MRLPISVFAFVAVFVSAFLSTACTTFSHDSAEERAPNTRQPASAAASAYPQIDCPFFKDLDSNLESFLANPDTVIQSGQLVSTNSAKDFPDPDKQFDSAFADEHFWQDSVHDASQLSKFLNFKISRQQLSSANQNSNWYGNNFLTDYTNALDSVAGDVQMALEAIQRMHSPSKDQRRQFTSALAHLNLVMLTPEQMVMHVQSALKGYRFDQDGFLPNMTCADLEAQARQTGPGVGMPSNFEHYAYSYIRLREIKKIVPSVLGNSK